MYRDGRVSAGNADRRGRGGRAARLRVVADPIEEAAARTRALVEQGWVRIQDAPWCWTPRRARRPGSNAELVSAGIDVSELGGRERELEDGFLELTHVA